MSKPLKVSDVLPTDPKERMAQLSSLARLAEAAERFEDMCSFMKLLVETLGEDPKHEGLPVEERNLLSVAYKHVIGTRRATWRTLNADEGRDAPLIVEYRRQVESELQVICKEVIALIEDVLVAGQASDEAKVFYLKMAGDYYRYLAEFMDRSAGFHDKAKARYQSALEIATGENGAVALPSTHPIRLGLALNYSVCFYEILGEKYAACKLAKQAFEDAIKKLDELDEHSYKDSTLIMQLLRDNLTLWTADASWDEDEQGQQTVQND